jgi:hypothetical protein
MGRLVSAQLYMSDFARKAGNGEPEATEEPCFMVTITSIRISAQHAPSLHTLCAHILVEILTNNLKGEAVSGLPRSLQEQATTRLFPLYCRSEALIGWST